MSGVDDFLGSEVGAALASAWAKRQVLWALPKPDLDELRAANRAVDDALKAVMLGYPAVSDEATQPDTPAGDPRRPVWFIDPATGRETRLTAREAAEIIVTLQAMEGEDNPIDPETTLPEMVAITGDRISTVLGMARDGECYAEHVEACVLPHRDQPHDFAPLYDDGSCEVCGDTEDDGPHPASRLRGEREATNEAAVSVDCQRAKRAAIDLLMAVNVTHDRNGRATGVGSLATDPTDWERKRADLAGSPEAT